jgi:dTDP-4-dehydrorhamnose 3,5-epimerase
MQIFFSLFVFGEVWRSKEKEVTLSSISINNKIMTYIETEIPGVWIIEPKVFKDARGYFMEAWKKAEFEEHIGKVEFVQDNESCSSKGVLRGLHYQLAPYSQSKLEHSGFASAKKDNIFGICKSFSLFLFSGRFGEVRKKRLLCHLLA